MIKKHIPGMGKINMRKGKYITDRFGQPTNNAPWIVQKLNPLGKFKFSNYMDAGEAM